MTNPIPQAQMPSVTKTMAQKPVQGSMVARYANKAVSAVKTGAKAVGSYVKEAATSENVLKDITASQNLQDRAQAERKASVQADMKARYYSPKGVSPKGGGAKPK